MADDIIIESLDDGAGVEMESGECWNNCPTPAWPEEENFAIVYFCVASLLNVALPFMYYFVGYKNGTQKNSVALNSIETPSDNQTSNLKHQDVTDADGDGNYEELSHRYSGWKAFPWIVFIIVYEALWMPILLVWPLTWLIESDFISWFLVFWTNMGVIGPYGAYWLCVLIFVYQMYAKVDDLFPMIWWTIGAFFLGISNTVIFV